MIDTLIEEPMLETIEEEEQNGCDLGKKLMALTVTKETIGRLTERADGHYNEATSACKCGVKSRAEELITFNGDPLIFKEFWCKFQSCIGSNEELSNIEKLSCLRGLLKGQALKSISDLKLTNSNYLEAVEILKIRYENKENLVKRYLEAIATLPVVKDITDMTSLQQCVDTLEISVNILCQLGKETDSYGSLLITLILDSIPDQLRISIKKRFNTNTNDIFTFIDVFKDEVGALEKSNLTRDCNLDKALINGNSLCAFNEDNIYSKIYSSREFTQNNELKNMESKVALDERLEDLTSEKTNTTNSLTKTPTMQNLALGNKESSSTDIMGKKMSSLEIPKSIEANSDKKRTFGNKRNENDSYKLENGIKNGIGNTIENGIENGTKIDIENGIRNGIENEIKNGNKNGIDARSDKKQPFSYKRNENDSYKFENGIKNGIENVIENGIENGTKIDIENGIRNGIENEIKNGIKNGIDARCDKKLPFSYERNENDSFRLRNGIKDEIGSSIENDIENGIGVGLQNGIDNRIENGIKNDIKNEMKTKTKNEIDASSDKKQSFSYKRNKNDSYRFEDGIENDIKNGIEKGIKNGIESAIKNEIENGIENNSFDQNLDSKPHDSSNFQEKSEINYHFGKITNSFNDQLNKFLKKDLTISPFSEEKNLYPSCKGDLFNGERTNKINGPKSKDTTIPFDKRKESKKCFLCSTKGHISQETFPHVACAGRIIETDCNYCEKDKNLYSKTNNRKEKNFKNEENRYHEKHEVRKFEEEHSDFSEDDEKVIKRQRRMCEYKKGVTIRKVKEDNSEFRMYDDTFYQHKYNGVDKFKTIEPKKRNKDKSRTGKDNTFNKRTLEHKRDLDESENSFSKIEEERDEICEERIKKRDQTKLREELDVRSDYKKQVPFDDIRDKYKGRGVRFTDQKYNSKNGDYCSNKYNKGGSYDNIYENKKQHLNIKRNASFNLQRTKYNHNKKTENNQDIRYCKSELNLYKPENDLYYDKEKSKNKIIAHGNKTKVIENKAEGLVSEPVGTHLKSKSKDIKRNLDNCEYFDCQTEDTERNPSPYEENMQLGHTPDSENNMSIFDVIYQNHLKRIAKNLSTTKSGEPNEEENEDYGVESDDSNESTTSSYGHYTDCSLQTDVISQCTLKRTPNPYNYKAKFIPRLPFVACKHRSYITEAMRNILKLKTLRQERIEIKSFASEQEFIETLDVVSICVQGKSGRNAYIDALVVPFICSSFENPRLKSIKDNFAYLKCLGEPETRKVNDDMFYIDILVGIEYYYSLVTGKTIKTPHDQPVAIERSLVWIVCGPNVQILL